MSRPVALEVIRLRPGPTATGWLSSRIAELQAGDALQPVTVVVPGHHAGLYLRRGLAGHGYANVRFTVLARLAEMLGAARLAGSGWAPLTAVTQAALARSALASAGEPLDEGAEHAGLADMLAQLATELRRRPDGAADAAQLRSSTVTTAAAVAAVEDDERRRAEARLYDEVDLLEAAAAAVADGSAVDALRDVGPVVVLLPSRLDPPDAALLRALGQHITVTVAFADAGEILPDGESVARFAAELPANTVTPGAAPASPTVVIAPDAVEEVRDAVRRALEAAERDPAIPLHRTAIVYRDEDTYAGLLRDTLDEAGVPAAALDGLRLVDSVPARALLGLVRLRDQDFTRAAVLAWLSGLPHERGVLHNQARWDKLSRDAGIVRGAAQWVHHLEALVATGNRTLEGLERDPEDPRTEAHCAAVKRDIADATSIAQHVAAIDAATRPPDDGTWATYVEWALRLRDEFLTPDPAWSAEDLEAAQAVEEAVRALGAAHDVEPAVSVHVFLRTLEDALRSRRRPQGRIGRGVVVGPHRLLLGLDVQRVHVLGAVEAAFPAALAIDPLLSGDPLGRQALHEARERATWLATLAAADGGEVVISAPAVDLDGRDVYPSPWLLETLAEGDRHPRASEVRSGRTTHPRLTHIPGGDAAAGRPTPLSLAERREVEARDDHGAGRSLAGSALARRDDLPLGRVLTVVRGRDSDELTEFDGNLAGVVDLPQVSTGLTGATQSATGMQNWAECPFRFLLGRVLRVEPTEDADDDRWWAIGPAERGTLIHRILEEFFAEVAASGHPAPGERYTRDDLQRLDEIAGRAFREAEQGGICGHPLVWANERDAIRADLRTLLEKDAEDRAAGWRPARTEQRFGYEDVVGSWPALTVSLGDGRSVAMRGSIDRVDVNASGGARVIDYKTGKSKTVVASAANLLDGGRQLQLAVYGRAVREHQRAQEGRARPVQAMYWYATTRGGFSRSEVTVDETIEEALADVLRLIDTGIRGGCFPQVPGNKDEFWATYDNCRYCPYHTLCPAARETLAANKAGSAALEPYRALQVDDQEEAP